MDKINKLVITIRNNWKKSAFAFVAFSYGSVKLKEKFDINVVMTAMCKEAASYGEELIPMELNPRMITVILNPAANKRSARKDFEKYCEPLLHLAGIGVTVIQTTSEGHAKDIVATLKGTEAIVVAGGDGTLCETVTGMFRRGGDATKLPVGVLPLGRTNSIGNNLFPGGKGVEKVKQLANATMAIIKDKTEPHDIMKIEPLEAEDNVSQKPIYALGSLEWGAFKDASSRRDKYWFYGPFRDYATYIFNGYKNSLTWNCSGSLKYTPPCEGCSNCVIKKPESKPRWSKFLIPKAQKENHKLDYSKVENQNCSLVEEVCFKATEVKLSTSNMDYEARKPVHSLKFNLGKPAFSYTEFVSEGWHRVKKGEPRYNKVIAARTIEIIPKDNEYSEDVHFAIDNEEFDVKPIKVTLLPKALKIYCNS